MCGLSNKIKIQRSPNLKGQKTHPKNKQRLFLWSNHFPSTLLQFGYTLNTHPNELSYSVLWKYPCVQFTWIKRNLNCQIPKLRCIPSQSHHLVFPLLFLALCLERQSLVILKAFPVTGYTQGRYCSSNDIWQEARYPAMRLTSAMWWHKPS